MTAAKKTCFEGLKDNTMRTRFALLVLPVAFLVACGGNTAGGNPSSPNPASVSGSAGAGSNAATAGSNAPTSVQAPLPGPEVPPASSVAAPVPAAQMPTATGAFGEKPELKFPSSPPPSLQRQVLSEGDGAVVKTGDFLVVNYLGQVWGGDVFDNSYDRGKASSFPLRVGQGGVISGWVVGLSGVKVGSRVLVSLPPYDGYGAAGGANGAIKGTDTIVFVVDIKAAYPVNATAQTDIELLASPETMPKVTGALGAKPVIEMPANQPVPTSAEAAVLAKGTGEAIKLGDDLIVQYVASVIPTGEAAGSTWPDEQNPTSGPASVPVSAESVFAQLVGVPIGSRVEMVIPGAQGQSQPMAVVLDVIAKV